MRHSRQRPHGSPGLERHAVADGVLADALADRDDAPGALVAEHVRPADDARLDAAVLVVVDVGAADADRGDLDEHVERPGLGHRAVLDADVAGRVEDRGAVGHVRIVP